MKHLLYAKHLLYTKYCKTAAICTNSPQSRSYCRPLSNALNKTLEQTKHSRQNYAIYLSAEKGIFIAFVVLSMFWIFKNLFGAAFNAKLVSLYNDHRRTWQDIIAGKPAYTEDLFYRIVLWTRWASSAACVGWVCPRPRPGCGSPPSLF